MGGCASFGPPTLRLPSPLWCCAAEPLFNESWPRLYGFDVASQSLVGAFFGLQLAAWVPGSPHSTVAPLLQSFVASAELVTVRLTASGSLYLITVGSGGSYDLSVISLIGAREPAAQPKRIASFPPIATFGSISPVALDVDEVNGVAYVAHTTVLYFFGGWIQAVPFKSSAPPVTLVALNGTSWLTSITLEPVTQRLIATDAYGLSQIGR